MEFGMKDAFAGFADHLPDIVLLIDCRGRCNYINSIVEASLGIKSDQLIGKPISHTKLPKEFLSLFDEIISPIFEDKQERTHEFTACGELGDATFRSRFYPQFSKDGDVENVVCIMQDITSEKENLKDLADSGRKLRQALDKSKQMQQQLEEYYRRLEQAQKLARLGFLECKIKDINEPRYYKVSHNVFDMFGVGDRFSSNDLIDVEELYATIHNDDRKKIKSTFENAMKHTGLFEDSFRVVHPNTFKVYYLHMRIDISKNAEGYHLVGFIADVTEKALLEQQLRNAAKMDAIGRLTGGITHDFNNILQVILGCGKNLLRGIDKDSPAQQYAQMIVAAGEKARVLVRQLLLFSQQKQPKFEYVDLNRYIQEIVRLITRLIGENIQLELNLAEDLMAVKADFDQIEQVLMNLCVNSRDAMPQGGKITISTNNQPLEKELEGKYVLLTVGDTGCGIPEDLKEQIYEPFFTTKELGRGTGLGLSNAFAIVKNHGGFIDCVSAENKGTTFKIYLPAVSIEPQRASESKKEPAEIQAVRSRTILLAEDDLMVRELTVDTLRQAGYGVLVAEDGIQAVELFRQNYDKIDMLVLDVIMPQMSGREVYDTIVRESPNMPVLFCSGYDRNTLKDDYLLNIGGKVLHKPYDRKTLIETVESVLKKTSSKKRTRV